MQNAQSLKDPHGTPPYETMPPHERLITAEPQGVNATPALDLTPGETVLFHGLLYPNRSLSKTGFLILMGALIVLSTVIGGYYVMLGAWPVIFFSSLDVILVWLAFKINYRQGRLHERVIITQRRLWVWRVLPSGYESRWSLSCNWTQVEIHQPGEHESRITLSSYGYSLIIGSFLSPQERVSLAHAIKGALARVSDPL